MTDPLEHMARRVEGEAFFLASLLAAHARTEQLDDVHLASSLGCAAKDLTMLRLCRTPRVESEEFWEDITHIAERFSLNPERLAEIVKSGRVVLRLQKMGDLGATPLLAARDHEPPSPPPEEL